MNFVLRLKDEKKIFILLPDGVGLRNFVFTQFFNIGIENKFDVLYWNNTDFLMDEPAIKVSTGKSHWITDVFKRSRKEIELKQFYKKSKDSTYLSYSFSKKFNSLKTVFKSSMVVLITFAFNSNKGLVRIRQLIEKFERNSDYYSNVKNQLEIENPSFVFSTNQRPLKAIAPILAAKDLGIPTGTFIFSWDNLPKGTLVIETDYYFVWSKHMRDELLNYYPFINESQIKITGTPQFELHYNEELYISRNVFFKTHNLDDNKKYICFSGDDITTSPNDHFYLEDVAKAIRSLNNKGLNLGLIYRKCPVDFSERHLPIHEKYMDVITLIDPLWDNLGNGWDSVMPTKEDSALLVNTVRHSELVINVGSSMVFDFIAHNKPCAFLNYNTKKAVDKNWRIEKIYNYIHFKSMPSKKAVFWIDSTDSIESIIKASLNKKNLIETHKWFSKICEVPSSSSNKIWKTINQIIN